MSQNKPYGYEDLMVVDYTGGYDIQQALNSKKRKRDMDSGVVAEEEDEIEMTDSQKAKLLMAMKRIKKKNV